MNDHTPHSERARRTSVRFVTLLAIVLVALSESAASAEGTTRTRLR